MLLQLKDEEGKDPLGVDMLFDFSNPFNLLVKNKLTRIAAIGMFLILAGSSLLPVSGAVNDDQIITFEEPIPVPANLVSQYCNNPDTNQGVLFSSSVTVSEPAIATASGTHAAMQIPDDDDLNPFDGGIQIVFTTGQSHVGVQVGLSTSYADPVTAYLRAYDDPDEGEGNKLTPDPDPSILLGTGPTAVTQNLSFSMPNGEATIRRIEIIFLNSFGFSDQEVIDDLTFSDLGPTCVTDTQPPTVDILQPDANTTFTRPEALLHYLAQDVGSGIARIRVSTLDASRNVLTAGFPCGGPAFPSTCPGNLSVESQFNTYLPREIQWLQVEATDFAGNTGQAEVLINMALPDASYNLWALAVELTQNIQQAIPIASESRSALAPQHLLDTVSIPMVANKRTVLRLYPGLEDSSIPVEGVRARLHCYTFLAATLSGSTPCDGPQDIEAYNAEIAVNPANGNDVYLLRRNPALTWNFILPGEWITSGGPRYLVAHIQAPLGLAECGSFTSGCDDGANFFILQVSGFQETARLIVKPRFACVRRESGVPKENCDAVATTPDTAVDVSQWFLSGKDWDNDGILDPFFNLMLPIADGGDGVEIQTPILNDYTDGNLNTADGNLDSGKMGKYLAKICDEFIFDLLEIFTDPGEILASAYPPNLRYLAFVPSPVELSGIAYLEHPCGVAKIDLVPDLIGDGVNNMENDYCSGCADDPRSTIHWDEPTVVHEVVHTMGVNHASCDHREESGGGCDPAPSVFPCPHGGICLSETNQEEPFGFNPYAMAVIPPNNGSWHAHDYMSYGAAPVWTSAHTYTRLFDKFRTWAENVSNSTQANLSPQAPQPVLYISGQIAPGENLGEFNTIYELPQQMDFVEGSGSYALELQDDQGQTLTIRRFEPVSPIEDGADDRLHFFEILALDPGAARLVLKADGQIIAERSRSPNAPNIQVTKPGFLESWGESPKTIEWQASDADGDSLVFTVQYKAGSGADWITLGVNLEGNSLQVRPQLLPGANSFNAQIRVFASDGFNSSFDDSAIFNVQGKSPMVRIQSPQTGATYLEGDLIDLIGYAFDAEDGSLPASAFNWSSNIDGLLGQGHNLLIRNLSPGDHIVTLRATDSNSQVSQATLQIRVMERTNRQPIAVSNSSSIVHPGTQITLDGQDSFDPDGDPIQFSWRFIHAPGGAINFDTLQGANTPTPSFLAALPGEYRLELVVRDDQVNSNPSQVVIQVQENILYMPVMVK